jgi:hypothetical protein
MLTHLHGNHHYQQQQKHMTHSIIATNLKKKEEIKEEKQKFCRFAGKRFSVSKHMLTLIDTNECRSERLNTSH